MERLPPLVGMRNDPLDSHIYDQTREDYEFMVKHGASLEEVARRLGLTVGALEKRLDRH